MAKGLQVPRRPTALQLLVQHTSVLVANPPAPPAPDGAVTAGAQRRVHVGQLAFRRGLLPGAFLNQLLPPYTGSSPD